MPEDHDEGMLLEALYTEIDQEVEALSVVHEQRLQCRRGCHACCLDDLTVTSIEAANIRRAHPRLLRDGLPHAVGACAFLAEDGACRIYPERPLVCRSQGLPLRILFENEVDEIEERRDICPLNLPGGPPLEKLADAELWLVGPHELRLVGLDRAARERGAAADGIEEGEIETEAPRVLLRSLFERAD